jgi:hypothetical protein
VTRPEKIADLIPLIHKCINEGRYLDTRHASERKDERGINRPEILTVLKSGYHEKKKDKFEEIHQTWNYAIRGKTVDKRELRIIVAFEITGESTGKLGDKIANDNDEGNEMLIITAIDLKK